MKATSELVKEHEGITLMLNIMTKVSDNIQKRKLVDSQHIVQIIEFLKIFADQCHHGKEEGILFPELVKKGFSQESGPIAVMLHEHTIGRGYIKDMADHFERFKTENGGELLRVADDMNKYISLLTNHIRKENQILFPMADKALPEDVQDQLFARYEKLEKEVIGVGRHEEFHKLLKNLKAVYLQ
jgi:hemerythrin-like domain-containing protein